MVRFVHFNRLQTTDLIQLFYLLMKQPQSLLYIIIVLFGLELYAQNKLPEFKFNTVITPNTSIRAVHKTNSGELWFAGSNAHYGYSTDEGESWTVDSIQFLEQKINFRALGSTDKSINLVSIESPGMVFKTDNHGESWYLTYYEEGEKVFYDAVKFYDSQEGIALGDPTEDCFSILKTRDGGASWEKLPCENLPKVVEGEAAFAASNTNIEIQGDKTWIVTGGKVARILFSPDRGKSWEVIKTPIISGGEMTGIYSVDFYDEHTGVIIGGDWNEKSNSKNNKAVTTNGGKSWKVLSKKNSPPYQSCIQFVPESNGKELISVGIPGVYYSNNFGKSWTKISNESFYAITMINPHKGVLTGNKKVTTLTF